jgi:ABC-type sugar transport system substrate-binding protein
MDEPRAGRIGLFLVSRQTGYQHLLAEEAQRAADQAGAVLEVFSGDDTAALQSAQIVRLLHAHAGEHLAVVVMPVSDIGHEQPLESLARKVLSRGAAWVVLNRDLEAHVTRMRAEFPAASAALIAIDNHEIGRIQGRQVRSLQPDAGGTVLSVLGNVHTSAARDRRAGLREVLADRVFAEVEGLWSADSAEKAVARWLASSAARQAPLGVVACQNDPMAVGARQVLHRLAREYNKPEWTRVPVLGVDGLPTEGRRLVDEGVLAATVVVPASSGVAVELLARAWRSGSRVPAKVVLEPKPYPAQHNAPLRGAAGAA